MGIFHVYVFSDYPIHLLNLFHHIYLFFIIISTAT
jgi:hypothetical protein